MDKGNATVSKDNLENVFSYFMWIMCLSGAVFDVQLNY